MKFGMARPSEICIRGPWVLKMRMIRVSTWCVRWYAIAYVAAYENAVIDVCLAKLEVGVSLQGAQILGRAGDEVVEREHAHVSVEQGLAKVRTNEAGPAGNYGPGLIRGQCRDT